MALVRARADRWRPDEVHGEGLRVACSEMDCANVIAFAVKERTQQHAFSSQYGRPRTEMTHLKSLLD